jgi:hypothetical protein
LDLVFKFFTVDFFENIVAVFVVIVAVVVVAAAATVAIFAWL